MDYSHDLNASSPQKSYISASSFKMHIFYLGGRGVTYICQVIS